MSQSTKKDPATATMRALALTILAVTLALGHALPYRKGIAPPPPALQIQQKGQQEAGQTDLHLGLKEQESSEASGEGGDDEDDLKNDPDWVPKAEDYEDDDGDDHDYVYEDSYEDEDYEPDYNEEEDELWSSDDDPDWLPEGGSEEDSHGDDEDDLWSSDDDPDWVPEDHSNEDSSDEASQTSDKGKIGNLDQDLIQELAEAMLVSSGGRGTLEDMVGLVVSLELTREEALDALDGLYKMIAEQEQGREQGKEAHPNDVDQTRPEIPRPSPESESFSKRPLRQYKGQYSQQQQDEYRQADQLDLARGVEPLSPGSQGRVDVGDGVEPVEEEDDDGYSFGDWFREGWRRASDKVEEFGDRAEDTFHDIGHSISGAVGTAVDKVHETAHAAGEHIVSTYEKAKEKLAILKQRLATIFTKLGVTIQLGAEYCFQKLAHAVDQVRSSQVLEKLEQELQKGNEQVSEFFSVLGQKVAAWQAEHPGTDIDAGLVVVHHGQQEGQGDQLGHTVDGTQNGEQAMPEFFWDQQVVGELDKLVEQGVLTQDDLQAFPLQQSTQGFARDRRERKIRAWVDSLRHFAY